MRIRKSSKTGRKPAKNKLSAARNTVKDLRSAGSFQEMLDTMIDVPSSAIEARVNKLRIQNPDASPADIQRIVTKKFRNLATSTFGAAGAVAAAPGMGTVAALSVSGAQLAGLVSEAGYYVLTLAHIHGIPLEEKEKRKLLVLTSLMGEQGEEIARSQFGFATIAALKGYASDISGQALKAVNARLAKMVAKKATRKGITALFGRLVPYGVGAVIGVGIGRSTANNVIEGAQNALGTPPATFSYPITVETTAEEIPDPASNQETQ